MAGKRKIRLSAKERARRKRQARINFGLTRAKKRSTRTISTRRRVASKRVPRKKTTRRRRSTMGGALARPLMAGVTYAFVQPIVSQLLRNFNIGLQDELAQILVAVLAKRQFKGRIAQNWANAAIIVNAASLTAGLASGFNLGNLFGGGGNGGQNSGGGNVIG